MDKQDWSKFTLRVNIRTSIAEAYNAWATPRGIEAWFLRDATFKDVNGRSRDKNSPIERGDTYEWYWHGYPDSVVEKGKILQANGKDTFSFTFSLGCPVTISIYEESGETIVQLVENDLPVDDISIHNHFIGDSRGWIFYLANLKSIMEGGIDLRNKKPELTNVITA
jgi:hypothetical protein